MTIYLYKSHEKLNNPAINSCINAYLKANKIKINESVLDMHPLKIKWTERPLFLLIENSKPGDEIVFYTPSHLACSISQILSIIEFAAVKKVNLHFAKSNCFLKNDSGSCITSVLLGILSNAEFDLVSGRTKIALSRRKEKGLPLGRPLGAPNKKLILDQHAHYIRKYLADGISKASISKLIGCHPQTLHDWLERTNVADKLKGDQK